MASLDLRSINLGEKNILTFSTKKQAKKFPTPHLCYITEAANRFWVFFVICRTEQDGTFSIMCKDETFLQMENRRWIGGKTTYVN